MTIAELITRITAENFNKEDFPSVKTEFLNASLGALEDVFSDVQMNFSALTELCGDSFTGTSFLDLVRKKILKHIENKSLRLHSSLDENDRVEFLKNWVNCVATLYSLTKNVSFEVRQKVEDDVRVLILNPFVLFHWIKGHIFLEKQSECLVHVWNALVLPSQSPDEDSQPSLMMQRFFEFSVQHLSIEMLEALESFQRISTYGAKSYYNSSGEIAPGFSALVRAKICQAIFKDILTAEKHDEFVEKFKQFSTAEISISDFTSEDWVKIFSRMEDLRVLAGLKNTSVDQDIKAFLWKQNVEKLFECLLPQCERINSAGLISALSEINYIGFLQQLVAMQREVLLDKIKNWSNANNFDLKLKRVSIAYTALENNENNSAKEYLKWQSEFLLEYITIDKNKTQVTQQVFIDRVKSLASIESLFSPDNIKYLLKKYWEFSSENKIASPDDYFLQCFVGFQQRITEDVDLQLQMLNSIVDKVRDALNVNPNLCWFIALVASQVSLDVFSSGQTHDCRVGLSRLRSSCKNDPKSHLSSMLAYVEVHYEAVNNSLLYRINHRQVTNLYDAGKESATGKKLNNFPKPATRISRDVAKTQLFIMPEDKLDEVQAFWSRFNGVAPASTIVGNRSSMLGVPAANGSDIDHSNIVDHNL